MAVLYAVAIGLLASIPLAALAWTAGMAVERATRAPALREAVWTLAFALPVLAIAAAAVTAAFPGSPASELTAAGGPPLSIAVSAAAATAPETWSFPWSQVAWWGAVLLPAASLSGAVARLLRLWLGYRRLRRLAAVARSLDRRAVVAGVAAASARFRVAPPPVLVHDDLAQPLLAGFRRSAVLLPSDLLRTSDDRQLEFICTHELAHLARNDNVRLVADELVTGLLWFNPPMAAIRGRMRAVREEVCDAAVLIGVSPGARRVYADTLMRALRPHAAVAQTAFTGTARTSAMRLEAILNPAPPAPVRALAGAAAVCAMLTAATGLASVAAAQTARDAAPVTQARGQAATDVARVSSVPADPSQGPWIVWGPGWPPRPGSDNPWPTRTVAGPDVEISVDGRRQPAGFVLESLDPITIHKLDIGRIDDGGRPRTTFDVRTTGPDLFAGEPAKVIGPPPRPAGPYVAASIGPEGMRLEREGYREDEVEIAIDGRVQPAGFKLESFDHRKVTAHWIEQIEGGGPAKYRVNVRTTPMPEIVCPPADICVLAAGSIVTERNDPRVTIIKGNPYIVGTATGSDRFLIDGRPAPAGLDLRTLTTETIDRIEVTRTTRDGRPETANTDPGDVTVTFNLFTKR